MDCQYGVVYVVAEWVCCGWVRQWAYQSTSRWSPETFQTRFQKAAGPHPGMNPLAQRALAWQPGGAPPAGLWVDAAGTC